MLSGFKGVKYGLTVPRKEAKPGVKKPLAVFADGDSDEDEQSKVARDIERQAQRKQSNAKVAELQAAALAEDPSIFDYDSHFDSMQSQREGPAAVQKQARKSQYIESLLDKAKERQKEQDIVYERKLLRERKAEDHLFGDKERFVTAAYKAKLEEDKKWLAEEALRDKIEAQQDVRKRGHMGDFYRNLLSNNVAFGTAEASASKPQPEANDAAAEPSSRGQPPGSGAQVQDEKWEQMRRAREAYEEGLAKQNGAAEAGSSLAASESKPGPPGRAAAVPGAERQSLPAGALQAGDQGGPATEATPAEQRPASGTGESAEILSEAAPPDPGPSREDKAAAARERFLARKRKAPA